MTPQAIDGGTFADSQAPAAASWEEPPVVHGGFFSPLVRATPKPAKPGWEGMADRILLAGLRAFNAEDVEYQPHGGDPYLLPSKGIFNESYNSVDTSNGASVVMDTPTLGVRRCEIPVRWDPLDLLVIRCRLFQIREVQRDSEAGAKLFLREFK